MKRTLLLGVLTTGFFYFSSPALAEYEPGPINRGGCYRVGDEQVKFTATTVSSNDDSTLDRIARSVPATCDGTHVWDDKWYYWTLPDNRAKYLLMTWKNINSGEYGYGFIQNTPSTWWYKSSRRGWTAIENNQQVKDSWSTNGDIIDIDIKNPRNSNGWTPNDIWYSFGY